MTPVTSYRGRTVALFGLGGSGLATALSLKAGGCDVIAWDEAPGPRAKAAASGIDISDLHAADWSSFAALVLSPGVPLTHPQPHWTARLAAAAGVEIVGDIDLFCQERATLSPGSPLVAITGTNGKSTTTALVSHLLKSAGREVAMGGNIGIPILALPPPGSSRIHVIECSSFQIDLAPRLAPSVGVLLNLTPDHLDRHGTMENYAAVKRRLVMASSRAVVGVDDLYCREIASAADALAIPVDRISLHDRTAGFFCPGQEIFCSGKPVASLEGIAALRGGHNAQNAMAATAAVMSLGLSSQEVQAGLRTFAGLPHRMEQIAQAGRILFINDSKATNADSTEKALSTFENGIFWIVGGKPKQGGIASLAPLFGRVAKAYLIGEASAGFAATLEGKVPYISCGTIDAALERAYADARASDFAQPVVLLSPACASYDQFTNFEVRGDHFRALTQNLLRAPAG